MKVKKFEIAEHLETSKDIQAFLKEIFKTGDTADLISALDTAARAKGMQALADDTGITRAGLYRALSPDGNPKFKTIQKVVEAFGCKLAIK